MKVNNETRRGRAGNGSRDKGKERRLTEQSRGQNGRERTIDLRCCCCVCAFRTFEAAMQLCNKRSMHEGRGRTVCSAASSEQSRANALSRAGTVGGRRR